MVMRGGDMELPEISYVIKQRRLELHLSLEYVAEKIGVNRSTVLRWEQGRINGLDRAHIYLLSKILYLPLETMFGLKGKVIEDPELVKEKLSLIEEINDIKNAEDIKQVSKFIKAFIKN